MGSYKDTWGRFLHLPLLACLQILFIILFGLFTRYDPATAYRNQYRNEHGKGSAEHARQIISNVYPMFQDVHVMIFFGIGFLMTFLRKYGLAAISLTMLLGVLGIQWSMLVSGFLHPHYDICPKEDDIHHRNERSVDGGDEPRYNKNCSPNWPWIDINLITMLYAEFGAATVLISFGFLLGTSTPIQLLIMTLIEIVLFNVNEVIGRTYLGAVDAGDTIFVHMFGAYFGLACSRVLYYRETVTSSKAVSDRNSDQLSLAGTVFLWLFWPSFNSSATAQGDAQMRAMVNTYLALCACAVCAFTVSGFVNPHRKFCMEHIQNATLAGGVVVGATADMMLTPLGAVFAGALGGAVSTLGYQYVTPFLASRCKVTDTCGVHSLHGLPSIMGGLLSVLMSALASHEVYDQYNSNPDPTHSSLHEIFPRDGHWNNVTSKWEGDEEFWGEGGWTSSKQAGRQMAAIVVTMVISMVGGLGTGIIMKWVAGFQNFYKTGATVVHMALNVGNVMSLHTDKANLPKDLLFDDNLFFYQEESEKEKKEGTNAYYNEASTKV